MRCLAFCFCLSSVCACGPVVEKKDESVTYVANYCTVTTEPFTVPRAEFEANFQDAPDLATYKEVTPGDINSRIEISLCNDTGNRSDDDIVNPVVSPSVSAEVA